MRFFSYDSTFGRLFLKLSYGCCLNFLWLVCCLPVFTIGASTTALYYTSFKIAKDEGSFITTMFFRSFRQNFKQATIIWLIMLAAGLLIGADAVLVYRLRAAADGTAAVIWTLLLAVLIACMIAYVIELFYIFPLLSIASNTTANMFKNAFLIGTHYLFVTLLVLFIHYAMFFLVVNIFTPFIIFGEGLCAVISAHLLLKIFKPLLYDPNAPEEENETGESGGENTL
ncbi:MAG: YesL family protein [Oscillospiraceae bacterium]|nr:YesL family protein [Clostridia bacterium]MBR2807611.1 YesL family protein [Oscillospiraceae bacterium]